VVNESGYEYVMILPSLLSKLLKEIFRCSTENYGRFVEVQHTSVPTRFSGLNDGLTRWASHTTKCEMARHEWE